MDRRQNAYSKIINVADCKISKKRLLAVEYLILIMYNYPTAKTRTLYKSTDRPAGGSANNSVSNGSALGLEPEPNPCNGLYHAKIRTVANGPVLPPKTRHFNNTTLAAIKYLSSDRIVTWSVRRLCSSSRTFTSRVQICDLTNIRWVALENPVILRKISLYVTATQRISVGSEIWKWEVNKRLELHNVRTDHVVLQLELKYSIGAKVARTVKM